MKGTVSHQGAIGNFFHCIFGHLLIHDQGNAVVRLAWVMLLDIVSNSAFKEGFKIGFLSLRQLLAAPRPKVLTSWVEIVETDFIF